MPDDEWEALQRRLVRFAELEVLRYRWNTPTGLPPTKTVQDFVNEAIDGLFEIPPRVRWDPAKGRPETLLRCVVRGDIQNLWRSAPHQRLCKDLDGQMISQVPDPRPSPEEEHERRERHGKVARLLEAIREHLADSPFLLKVLEQLLKGRSSAVTAEELGVSAESVYGASRTIKRRIRHHFGDDIRDLLREGESE